ncbi:MAG: type II secretion system F family protein [Planctomycetota bacterium]|jgi:type IV pilus assembly protein PilC
MKSYKFIARDSSGQRKEGLQQAGSSNDVLAYLREEGFTPISVTEMAEETKKAAKTRHRKRIKSGDLAAFCWQLTTMVEGGVTITAAIGTIAEDIENLQFREILKQIEEKMQKGQPFSESISEFPKLFNKLSQALVLAGETGGTLPEALRRMAEYFDNRDKLAKKVKGAMAYPIFVLTFIVLIVVFIMAFIIPRFRKMFDEMGNELPAFTQAFMGFYDILRHNIIYIIGSVTLLITFAVLTYTRTKKGHYIFSRIVLAMPLFGKIISHAFIAMFCKTMSTLISGGVSVLEVFDILTAMANNDVIKSAILRTREKIVGGSSISLSLASSGFFPNMVVKMIQVGEESGSLSNVLDRTAVYYERKVDATITTVMGLLEPIMIITVGAIVLAVVLALYLPIFTMSGT